MTFLRKGMVQVTSNLPRAAHTVVQIKEASWGCSRKLTIRSRATNGTSTAVYNLSPSFFHPVRRLVLSIYYLCIDHQVKGAAHSTYEKAKEVNEEHNVIDKAKAGASRAWGRIKEVRKMSPFAGDVRVRNECSLDALIH